MPIGSSFAGPRVAFIHLTDLPPVWCRSCGCLHDSRLGQTSLTHRPKERKLALVISVSAPFPTGKAEVAKRCLPGRMSAKVDHDHHVVGRIDLGSDLHHRSVDSCAVARWQIS